MEQVAQAMTEKFNRISSKAKRMIFVTFQREGIHCYPLAATDPALADVRFLGTPHRHIFHFRVDIEVYHNDRDIEFIRFKRWLESRFSAGIMALNHKSCEMICDEMYMLITARYPDRDIQIEVSEDGENGCTVYYNRHEPAQSMVI